MSLSVSFVFIRLILDCISHMTRTKMMVMSALY